MTDTTATQRLRWVNNDGSLGGRCGEAARLQGVHERLASTAPAAIAKKV